MRPTALLLLPVALLAACVTASAPADAASPVGEPRLTWLSVTNWLLEVGDTRVLLDGYLTRIDRDFWSPMDDGPGAPFSDGALASLLDSAGVRLVVLSSYYQRFRLDGGRP